MGSFTHLTYHIVFATKYRRPTIRENIRERLYEYVGGTLRGKQGSLIEIGGVADHLHLLARLSPSLAISDMVRDVKANSSKWLNEQLSGIEYDFEWQKDTGRSRLVTRTSIRLGNTFAIRKSITEPGPFRKNTWHSWSATASNFVWNICLKTNTQVSCCRRFAARTPVSPCLRANARSYGLAPLRGSDVAQ